MKNLEEQYKNESNLQKRIQIHQYGTAQQSWNEFLVDEIQFPKDSCILEIGCGTGVLWKHLLKNKPSIKKIILSDFSDGMLKNAEGNLTEFRDSYDIEFKKIDATTIPLENDQFDIVIANHVLYHVSDVEKSLSEISKVLKPGGLFYASTIGSQNMHQLKNIVKTYFPSVEDDTFFGEFLKNFSLDDAVKRTQSFFSNSERIDYKDYLLLPSPKPLIDYISSFNFPDTLDVIEKKESFEKKLLEDFDFSKGFRIDKEIGLIKCVK